MSHKRSFTFRLNRSLLQYCALSLILLITLSGCSLHKNTSGSDRTKAGETPAPYQGDDTIPTEALADDVDSAPSSAPSEIPVPTKTPYHILVPEGTTLETRINAPEGYHRSSSGSEELTGFLRNMAMKEDGSPVLLYDGSPKGNQENHAAVFDLEIGDRDLQQCADSVLRIYAEYYWSLGAYEKIAFHLTNGFLMEYAKWREGYRLVVEGNDTSWSKSAAYDDSYEAFRNYLNMVFAYAGTLSLSAECKPVALSEAKPGDLLLQGGSPGHCILIVDMAEDASGNRCFLLAQGYMPAQEFHVIKNPLHEEDPWYYEEEFTYPFITPAWTFEEGSLVRWADFPLEAFTAGTASSEGPNNSAGQSAQDAVPAMSGAVLPSQDVSQITLLAVGDNLIHIEVVKSGKQKDGTYQYDHLYANLTEEIQSADIAVVNQETILGGADFAYSGYPNFNSPTEIGDALITAGFDVVLHATNHTLDMGVKGVKNTFTYWEKHPEITILGINRSEEEKNTIPIIERNGIKLAMLNYTYGLNGYKLPKDKPYLVNLIEKERMAEDIARAKELADFVIVFPHWGAEYVYDVSSMQKDLTDFFYQAGVDLVIGTHPHVIEPVEWIGESPEHRMLVYYSLGNFMSYQKEAPRMLGGMATVTITKDTTGTYISDAGITPIVTHYENGPADYHYGIYKLTDYTPELASVHGVSDIARQGTLTYKETYALAKDVLVDWFKE